MTEPLRFDHNKPYQIARLEGVPEEQIAHVISRTRVSYTTVQHGDIIVMGSDGIFDNLHNEDVVSLVEKTCPWAPPRPSCNRQVPQQLFAQGRVPAPSVAQLE